jgi:hypothetical protein
LWGCDNATRVTFFGGAKVPDDQGIGETGYRERAHNYVFIPGDWGYIFNDAYDKDKEDDGALAGENIIHVGLNPLSSGMLSESYLWDDLFWGHFSNELTIYPLMIWYDIIRGWDSEGKAGIPRLKGTVQYPIIGLE